MMTTVQTKEPQKIHPHKFTLWVGMGSIVMMFAADLLVFNFCDTGKQCNHAAGDKGI
jgi:hypothetical protein